MVSDAFSTDHVDYLQRVGLLPLPSARGMRLFQAPPRRRRWWRVVTLGRSAVPPPPPDGQAPSLPSQDVLNALAGHRIPLAFLVHGEPGGVGLYWGTWSPEGWEGGAPDVLDDLLARREQVLHAALGSLYPGIRLVPEPPAFSQWPLGGMALGIPTARPPGADRALAMDRLLRAMAGASWAAMVLALPEEEQAVGDLRHQVMNEMRRVGAAAQAAGTPSPLADHYNQLLNIMLVTLTYGQALGAWRTAVYLLGDQHSYDRLAGGWRGVFSGENSLPEPVRVFAHPEALSWAAQMGMPDLPAPSGPGAIRLPYANQTLLTSEQLAAMVHLPNLESPGYFVRESADFDLAPHVPAGPAAIGIGKVVDRGRRTGAHYSVRVDDLTRHALIVGITGSGKTNTTFSLLQQLARRVPPVHSLVIEPAKREYRRMLARGGGAASLHVFTVGEEGDQDAPFRLNPFEVRTFEVAPGVWRSAAVQTHIDLLKSVFNASFGMWAPLPQVLERAIHEIYRDKGWDPVRGTNERATLPASAGGGWHPFAQPTMSDLFHKISQLVPTLGYDREVERNVRTALETRINSLRIGAKGLMLDTPRSIPIEALLRESVVLELDGVGDDDEKAFLIGLVLMGLYEYYRAQGLGADAPLRHVTVVEEAHRLLANVAPRSDPEAGNLRGKAVETFVNMLSEVRAYGEGMIICEQIPTKLSPDVIKNTALKIMHRTVAVDDRQVMGGAMNLDERQVRQVVSLAVGEAVVHGGGRFADDNPLLIEVDKAPGKEAAAPAPAEVRRSWEGFCASAGLGTLFHAYPSCAVLCRPPNPHCADTRRIAEEPALSQEFSALVLTLVAAGQVRPAPGLGTLLQSHYPKTAVALRASITGLREDPVQTRCTLTHCLYSMVAGYGARYGWRYVVCEALASRLLPALLAAAAGRPLDSASLQGLAEFCHEWERHCRLEYEPFFGCARACGASPRCLFRPVVEPLTRDDDLRADFAAAVADLPNRAKVCQRAAERVIAFSAQPQQGQAAVETALAQSAALCFAIQNTHAHPDSYPAGNRRAAIGALLQFYGR